MLLRTPVFFLFLLALSWPHVVWAEVTVDRIYPPAVVAGQTSVVTAEGKFEPWPAEVWCDRDDVTVTPADETGQWNIRVAAGAAPGLAWLRFYDGISATPPRPLLIETVPVVAEVEPNNSPTTATPAPLPSACVGRLDKAGEVDCYLVTAEAGQTLVASVIANRVLGSPMDGVLQIVDLAGNVLAQNDDARGYDPQVVFPVAHSGQYVVRLFAFPTDPNSTIGFSGAASYVYRLAITSGPLINHVLPLVGSDGVDAALRPVGWNLPETLPLHRSPATAISPSILASPEALGWELQPRLDAMVGTPCVIDLTESPTDGSAPPDVITVDIPQLPALISGRMHGPRTRVKANVTVPSGQAYRTVVFSQSADLKLDSVITVTDRDSGKQLARNDDQPAGLRDAAVDFSATSESGTANVEVQVHDLVGGHGPIHDFTLAIFPRQPSVTMTVAASQFAIEAGKTSEIVVTIVRRDGLDRDLTIHAQGLPSGITAAPVTSIAKEDSGKQVTLKLEASAELPAGHHTFRIIAKSADEAEAAGEAAEVIHAAATASVGKRFLLRELWLTTK